jgi:alpha-tubulin suppressor-like RCC1 family protein
MPNQFLSPEGDIENYFITEYWLIDQYVGDTLWTWGQDTSSQLGDNSIVNKSTPVTTLAGGANWKQIACGQTHTAAIKTDGTLWTWGANGSAQLGDNSAANRATPITTFAGGTNWKQVACGYFHTAAIKTDGTLWLWGAGSLGQLGNNAATNRSTPVTTFAGGTNWKQIATRGLYHNAAIKTDGTLWVWGRNNTGQLGDNTVIDRSIPVTTFVGGTNWKQSACGANYASAIKTDGTLWSWGECIDGQLGINASSTIRSIPVTTFIGGTNWKQVTCGERHIAAIKTDGTLWVWGRNVAAQLGINNTTQRNTPVTTFAGGTNWKQVFGGYQHMAAIKTDGTMWIWGENGIGQLGINSISSRSTPVTTFAGGTNWKQVACGRYFSSAVTSGTDPTYFIS